MFRVQRERERARARERGSGRARERASKRERERKREEVGEGERERKRQRARTWEKESIQQDVYLSLLSTLLLFFNPVKHPLVSASIPSIRPVRWSKHGRQQCPVACSGSSVDFKTLCLFYSPTLHTENNSHPLMYSTFCSGYSLNSKRIEWFVFIQPATHNTTWWHHNTTWSHNNTKSCQQNTKW